MPREVVLPAEPPVSRPSRRGSRFGGLALAGIGLTVVAGIADPELARDIVALGGVGAALTVILNQLRPQASAPLPLATASAPDLGAAEAEMDAKAHFLALAAHEIRTPLTGILGLADLLGETALTAEQKAYVAALRASGTTLLRLVDGYLDLSRLEDGNVEPTPVPTSLETVVEDVIELLAPPCQAKGLELAGFVAPRLSTPVLVDPLLLRQVLVNLTGNAVKFTETGGVAIEVERVPGSETGVAFRVRDTGIGIDVAEASRIFDAWERIETEGVGSAAGTGLGLAIARGIVERMGGTIGLVSRPGEGSTFAFELDLPAAGPAAPLERPLRGRRIGLISRAVVEPPLLVRRLHALGAEACLVDAPEALATLDPCDVVLIDGQGGADPVAVLDEWRALGSTAPAVVLIPPGERNALPALRAAGFAAHLIRPIRPASLARVVALAAERGEAPRAPSLEAPEPTGGLRVLLVDDNEINALLGRAALEHDGHGVAVVEDGLAALDAIAAAREAGQPFAAVLMDLHMPGLDGFTAIRELRAGEPAEAPRALVVAVTADATPSAAERALACGADAVLVKPIDRDRLATILAEARNRASLPVLDRAG